MVLRRYTGPIIVVILGLILMVRVLAMPQQGTAADLAQSYPPDWTPEPTVEWSPYPFGTPTTGTAPTTLPAGRDNPSETVPTIQPETPSNEVPTETPELDNTSNQVATPTNTPTLLPESQVDPSVNFTATPTSDLMGSYAVCVPNEPLLIRGEGPAFAPFLLYFDNRAVSGGSVGADGLFEISLIVGRERPGSYEVSVRLRENGEVLQQFECSVPPTPTPTPIRGRP
jgi:hypothetical protein